MFGLAMSVAVALLLLAGVLFGAKQLEFMCDDAYITFRYIGNAMDGHGLVWNAPPFQPVEGYSGFLWALLLWAVWSWFGVEPPDSANTLSIIFGLATLIVVGVAAMRLRRADGTRLTSPVVFLTLAVLASSRCFLQWMTGGLETSLFIVLFVSWVLLAFRSPASRSAGWLAAWCGVATAAALTRPDGLLLVAASGGVAVCMVLMRRLRPASAALACLPLLVVALHLVWRHSFYGEWLPNTYCAKVTSPWPEAGLRYLYCFLFENGLWLWPPIAVAWFAVMVARRRLVVRRSVTEHLPATAAIAAVAFHTTSDVLIGGDHFEYRVFGHLVPLAVLATAAMLAQCSSRVRLPVAGLLALVLTGSVAWLHLALTRPVAWPDYDGLTDKLPSWAQPLTLEFDRNQAWLQLQLQLQFNCARCNSHQLSLDMLANAMPPRHRFTPDPNDVSVMWAWAVGLISWRLPDCAIIDHHGLNDWVVARTEPYKLGDTLGPAMRQALAEPDGTPVALTRSEIEAQLKTRLSLSPGIGHSSSGSDHPNPAKSVTHPAFTPSTHQYGWDAIHVKRRHWRSLVEQLLGAPRAATLPRLLSTRVRWAAPERRWSFRRERIAKQPSVLLRDGTSVSLF